MKQDLFPEEPDKITKLLKAIREARFFSGLGCVQCGGKTIKCVTVNIVVANVIIVKIAVNHLMI